MVEMVAGTVNIVVHPYTGRIHLGSNRSASMDVIFKLKLISPMFT